MKRFFAVVGVVAFVAACSDSNIVNPTSQARAGAAVRDDGDPPPPPLSGQGGIGSLDAGPLTDFAAAAQTTDACTMGHPFSFVFSWSYLQANGSTNELVHVDLTSGSAGSLTLHDIQSGKVLAHGTVADATFSFTIQDTQLLTLTEEGFDASVTGTLTNLTSGFACQTSATLHGSFIPTEPPPTIGD